MQPARRNVVAFDAAVLEAIVRESRRRYPLETGGILMGTWRDETHAVVTAVVGPGRRAEHSSDAFSPDQRWHEQEVARIYTESGRTATYLGDWHSHPDGCATPSLRDASAARRIADAPSARAPRPIMAIVSVTNAGDIRLAPFILENGRLAPARAAVRRQRARPRGHRGGR